MKKFGSKFSNRTKVIGGMTILLGVGTVISAVKDSKELKEIENDSFIDGLEDAADGVIDTVEDIADSVDVENF